MVREVRGRRGREGKHGRENKVDARRGKKREEGRGER